MFKYVVKYKNFDNEEVERTLRFNFNKTEMIRIANETNGIAAKFARASESRDMVAVTNALMDLVEASYGVVEDGDIFIKEEAATNRFMQSLAFEKFILDITNDEKLLILFFTKLLGHDLIKQALDSDRFSGEEKKQIQDIIDEDNKVTKLPVKAEAPVEVKAEVVE